MKPIYIRTGALVLVLIGVIVAALGAQKTVTLVIDGSPLTLRTFAMTAGQALRDANEPIAGVDRVSPSLTAWIKNGDIINLDHAAVVYVSVDRQTYTLISAERKPAALVAELNIQLKDGDILELDGTPVDPDQVLEPSAAYRIQVVRTTRIQVNDTEIITTTSPTLAEAFWESGIHLYAGDRFSIPALTSLDQQKNGNHELIKAAYTPSKVVTIHTSESDIVLRTAAVTVGEALAEAGLSPQGLDYSQPELDQPIPSNEEIRLVRIEERVTIEQTPLAFETEFQPDPETDIDSQSVLQPGEYGLTSTRVRVRYEDGLEVGRTTEAAWISRLPLNRIVGYGTNIVMKTITTSDGATIQYWRALQMWATSYRPLETSNTTASGLPLQKGVCAIDRRYIPFFTQMYIPGYGNCTAADVGGGVRGRWIDLGYSNEDYQSWARWVTVYFLWPPPAFVAYIFP